MSKNIPSLLHKHLYAIIDIVGEAAVLFVAFGSGLVVRWAVEKYLSGVDAVLFWSAQFISDMWIIIPPAIEVYRRTRILWIKAQADIRKAKEKAEE